MKKLFLIVLVLLLASCANKPEAGNYKCPDCNVILISIDTLRADHLGCYGYERNTNPSV